MHIRVYYLINQKQTPNVLTLKKKLGEIEIKINTKRYVLPVWLFVLKLTLVFLLRNVLVTLDIQICQIGSVVINYHHEWFLLCKGYDCAFN